MADEDMRRHTNGEPSYYGQPTKRLVADDGSLIWDGDKVTRGDACGMLLGRWSPGLNPNYPTGGIQVRWDREAGGGGAARTERRQFHLGNGWYDPAMIGARFI